MLDFGWAEFLLIGLVLLLVVGPQDIPKLMYQAGKILRRLHYMKFALSQQFDSFMETAEKNSAEKSAPESKASLTNMSEDEAQASPDISDEDLMFDKSNPHFVESEDEADLDEGVAIEVASADIAEKSEVPEAVDAATNVQAGAQAKVNAKAKAKAKAKG